jgi:hypothetical protein
MSSSENLVNFSAYKNVREIGAIGSENWYFRIRPKAQRQNSNLSTAKGLKEMGLPHFVK